VHGRFFFLPVALSVASLWSTAGAQQADKQLVVTISGTDLKGGVVSEITWDGGVLVMQGVFANPAGALQDQYFVVPAERISLQRADVQPAESLKYWQMKSNVVSPTGLGRIAKKADTKMPQVGIGSLERRLGEAHDMGGTQTRHVLKLGDLVILERDGIEPYDGETWSWSPAELNKIAYVDGKGDLWVAGADGRDPRRVLRGDFTLPAGSPDGQAIAIAERRDGGRRWDISVVHFPASLR
jgi:hypothetical protein